MTKSIRVGDRVQWWEEFKNTKHEPRMMTGTVQSRIGHLVGIKGDGEDKFLGGTWVREIDKLTVITDTAIAAQPLDDAQHEQAVSDLHVDEHGDLLAVHESPFELIAELDDLYAIRWAGATT